MCQAQADTPGTFTESGMTLQTSSGNIQGTLCLPMAKGSYPVALIIAGSGPTDRNGNNPYMKNNSLLQLSHALAWQALPHFVTTKGHCRQYRCGKK